MKLITKLLLTLVTVGTISSISCIGEDLFLNVDQISSAVVSDSDKEGFKLYSYKCENENDTYTVKFNLHYDEGENKLLYMLTNNLHGYVNHQHCEVVYHIKKNDYNRIKESYSPEEDISKTSFSQLALLKFIIDYLSYSIWQYAGKLLPFLLFNCHHVVRF